MLILWTLHWKPMRQKALFCSFLFFGGVWIFGKWGAVGWDCKSYLGPAEIASFSSRSFSHSNQIWFKCETPLLIIFYYISFDQQSSADVFQNRFLKNFANSTGKHLCWSPFSISFQAFTLATSLKRDSHTGVFLPN